RLLVFARKPAPVQASWLGFGYTTGLDTMDYLIGDAVFTPPGCEHLFSEKIHRLGRAPWVYQPPAESPEPGDSPALRNGQVTFACLSRTERINARMIEAWARILQRLPEARLRLDSSNFSDAGMRQTVETQFTAHGVPAHQLHFAFTTPVWNAYREVDIVLDCFPHNSGTTTYEALWMGVPVVTLADRPSVGRLGASILSCIGKPEWIAGSVDDYVERAVALAQDTSLLARERASLRQTMLASPLLDQDGFARDMETAYRNMWIVWCGGGSPGHADSNDGAAYDSIEAALDLHRTGHLQEAEDAYKRILQASPDHVDALHSLGLLHHHRGDNSAAASLIRQAIDVQAKSGCGAAARLYSNLGLVLEADGKIVEAITAFRQAVELEPDDVEACLNLGNGLRRNGQRDEATEIFRLAIARNPGYAKAHNNLGMVLLEAEKRTEAIACYEQAIKLAPDYAEAWLNLGVANKRFPGKAAECYRKAIELRPEFLDALNNLAATLIELGKPDEALEYARRTLALNADHAEAHYNIGVILQSQGRLEEAIVHHRRAIELKPDYADAYSILGINLQSMGRMDEAIACYEQALRFNPEHLNAQSNLLFCVNYHPTLTAEEVYARYREWNARCAARFAADIPPFA
ncbi:tetratricopeptide repeat protein, partial [Noviherbaspirillum sp. ST9]|uniref:tetratricopeptide repeat protein n=1 Tax=Noviherbaspirillum sp. ST9 TaxID=3401606 RepID=UPI003B58ADA7